MNGRGGYPSGSGGFAKCNCENFKTSKACTGKTFVNGSVCSVCMAEGDFDYPELTKGQKGARIREHMARARRGGSHGGSRGGCSGGSQGGASGGGQGGGQERLQWRRTMTQRIEHGRHEGEPGTQPALGREQDAPLC
ncbi:hypothetical protein B0T24DRAFT_595219 [Lasiosphaeria ovina]|uniref:Uncharacterized protein n=1 Tax=Lasiosphaeria ovina TaxID=92902 RepID=A0AAE0N5Y5_9PEZI|nr:hypothetical protein B0T24DRAFT_595219 [Lasiosphaeria ovina]